MKNSSKIHVLIIVGPTASGKSQLSTEIAQLYPSEIVSADSRQVYQYMDIGTAKPTSEQRMQAPHHCIDIKDPKDYFSAGEYGKLAISIVDNILSRNHLPIVVGGSGLYIQALADGLFKGNYRDAQIRQRLKQLGKEKGWQRLYAQLKQVDPDSCQVIHQNDHKRIVRALEVYQVTGMPISKIQVEETIPSDFSFVFYGLRWPRVVLYQRIEARVEIMIEQGLIDEVQKLRQMGYSLEQNSLDSVGYKEIFAYLENTISLDEAIRLIKQNTRRYAKRQLTWFNRDERIHWIDLEDPVDWKQIAKDIIDKMDVY